MNVDVVVAGAGPAGMMAAITAAARGLTVVLIEKNQHPGKKLLLTGNGRCNLTNAVDTKALVEGYYENGKYLYSAFHKYNSYDLCDYFNSLGVLTKVEDNGRVFPVSERSSDIVNTLKKEMINNGVEVIYNCSVLDIISNNHQVSAVKTTHGTIDCHAVIVATGSLAWPQTGSTGDGYIFAKKVGHNIIKPQPALTGLELLKWPKDQLKGISFKKVQAQLSNSKATISQIGDIILTHYGVSGPVILNISRFWNESDANGNTLSLDLYPDTDYNKLVDFIKDNLQKSNKKIFKSVLNNILPNRYVEFILQFCDIRGDVQASHVANSEIFKIAKLLKKWQHTVKKPRPFSEAMVTTGGVDLKEVNPRTMESTICNGLFFVGEVLNIDGKTGGFNLQAAFSTGYLAGVSIQYL